MKKILYILVTLNLILTPLYTQPSITWSKIYNPSYSSDYASCVSNSGNGFYYVGGQAQNPQFVVTGYLIKINEYGDTVWAKFIDSILIGSIVPTPDNGCIISGDGIFARLDTGGNTLWMKRLTVSSTLIRTMKKTTDGKYIACGMRYYEQDGVVLKFDLNGNINWSKIYPTGAIKNLISIDELPNGGYIVTGSNKDYASDTNKTLLLRIDSTGNFIWKKKYKVLNRAAYGGFIKKIPGGFFVAGRTTDTANVVEKERNYFIRTDTSGLLVFTKLFPFYKRDFYATAQYINDNRFIFSSYSFSQIFNDTSFNRVFITDTLGNIIFSRNFYSFLLENLFSSIIKLPNNDLICAGYVAVPAGGDAYLVCRVDSTLQGPPIGIKNINSHTPDNFYIYQNYPNPFNLATKIKFSIPPSRGARGVTAKLTIYDILGREIATLVNQQLKAGEYEVEWNATNYPSGIYFYRLSAGEYTESKKMVLIK